MKNLLKETLSELAEKGKTTSNVVAIINGTEQGTWSDFEKLADIEYDNGYGGAEISQNLVVLFDDGSWLERGEYDGAEWWEFKKTPSINKSPQPLSSIKEIY